MECLRWFIPVISLAGRPVAPLATHSLVASKPHTQHQLATPHQLTGRSVGSTWDQEWTSLRQWSDIAHFHPPLSLRTGRVALHGQTEI